MHKVSTGVMHFQHQRLQNDHARLRNEVLSEFSSKTNKLFNTNSTNSVTAFSAPGASSADFEEMTFMMQKTMESKMKSLSRRRISTADDIELWGAKGSASQRIADIQKLRQIYEQLDNTYNPGHLQKHAKFLYELAAKGESFSFTDSSLPAGSYIQLKEAEQIALRKNDKTAEQNIKAKLAELDKDESFSRKIDAGLNTAEIFKHAYSDNSDRHRMQAIYYNNILGSASAGALMQSLISTFGEQNLGQNIDKLSKAVLADMNAGRPSSNFKHLTTKLNDLNRINTCRSVISDCKEFIRNMEKKEIIGTRQNEQEVLNLAKEILALSSGSIFANDLERISTRYAGNDADNKLTFMNAFYPFLKSLPEGIWANTKSRLTGLQTILVHLENEAMKLHKAPVR